MLQDTLQDKIDAMTHESRKYVSPEGTILWIDGGEFKSNSTYPNQAILHFVQWHGDWKIHTPFQLSEEFMSTLESEILKMITVSAGHDSQDYADIRIDLSGIRDRIKSKLPARKYDVSAEYEADCEEVVFKIESR